MTRICAYCGAAFVADLRRTTYCSVACAMPDDPCQDCRAAPRFMLPSGHRIRFCEACWERRAAALRRRAG